MKHNGCLIIDDVTAALGAMTDLGRAVTSEAAECVRSSVLDFAIRRDWAVVPYGAYVSWVLESVAHSDTLWLTLDPLFPISSNERIRGLRISRDFDLGATVVRPHYRFDGGSVPTALQGVGPNIGVFDDAASSGGTLRRVTSLLSGVGLSVSAIRICAASRTARDVVRHIVPGAEWRALVLGDWKVIHLRDGCPYLPFSGRPSSEVPLVGSSGREIHVVTSPFEVRGNLWSVLALDSRICAAVAAARTDIARRLSFEIGRKADLRDLDLLGQDVAALKLDGAALTL